MFSLGTVWASGERDARAPKPTPYWQLYSKGCRAAVTWDDGSKVAICPDNTVYYYDPDGQPYANDAGTPTYDQGWYLCDEQKQAQMLRALLHGELHEKGIGFQ